jgi:hypothetical protein
MRTLARIVRRAGSALSRAPTLMIAVSVALAIGAAATCLGSQPALAAADKIEPRFVWPKNSKFTCSGVLVQEQGGYRLTPDQGMLAWCDADIDDQDKDRVLVACKLGERCEIKGTIRGHGTFRWIAFTSVKARPAA